MNWVQKIFNIPFVKIASKNPSNFSNCTFNGPTNINFGGASGYLSDDDPNNTYSTVIRKNDRYASDPYRVWITKSANKQGMSLVLEIKAERDGMVSYGDSWKYGSNEVDLMEKRLIL